MAETVETFEIENAVLKPEHERKRKYPWNQWFDGRIWKLERGVDFQQEPVMMERVARTRASKRLVSLKVRHSAKGIEPEFILLQATAKDATPTASPEVATAPVSPDVQPEPAHQPPPFLTSVPNTGVGPAIDHPTSPRQSGFIPSWHSVGEHLDS